MFGAIRGQMYITIRGHSSRLSAHCMQQMVQFTDTEVLVGYKISQVFFVFLFFEKERILSVKIFIYLLF